MFLSHQVEKLSTGSAKNRVSLANLCQYGEAGPQLLCGAGGVVVLCAGGGWEVVQGQGGGLGKQGAGHCVLHRLWAQGEVDCRHLRSLIYQDRMKPVQTAEGSQEDTGRSESRLC